MTSSNAHGLFNLNEVHFDVIELKSATWNELRGSTHSVWALQEGGTRGEQIVMGKEGKYRNEAHEKQHCTYSLFDLNRVDFDAIELRFEIGIHFELIVLVDFLAMWFLDKHTHFSCFARQERYESPLQLRILCKKIQNRFFKIASKYHVCEKCVFFGKWKTLKRPE